MFVPRWSGRRGLIFTATFLALAFFLWELRHGLQKREYYMSPGLSTEYANRARGHGNTLPAEAAASVCRIHGFAEFPKQRKVYDLVMFSTELDWLEIRLHSHADYVDYFVIIESPVTFTGLAKPLLLKDNWDRFSAFYDKIIYRTIEDRTTSTDSFQHEEFLRNAMLLEVFPTLTGPQKANRGDALIVADMDELLRPGTLLLLRHCDFPARLTLRSRFYYYSFQWRHRGKQWKHPDATVFGSSVADTIAPNDLRIGNSKPGRSLFNLAPHGTLWDAGWHCSSCFSTLAEMRTKMQSFSHTKWNTPANREPEVIVERVRQGLDLFGRRGEFYDRVERNEDVPEYVRREYAEEGRFGYLLDRDGEGAGFEDWEDFRDE